MKLKAAGQWLLMMLVGLPLYAEGIESITGQGIIQRVGTIVKNVGGVLGVICLMYALVWGGLLITQGDDRGPRVIKGGLAGAFLCVAAYALANWLSVSFK